MMISGQDGILTRAGNAKVLNDKATIEEKIKLAVIASYNDDGELTVENVISNIEKSLPNAEITGEDFPIIVTEEGYSYEIDSEGTEKNVEIAKREGIKVGDYVNYVPDTAEAYASTKLDRSITGWDENTADLIQETLNWQVLRIYDDGSMDLIGSPTSQDVYFCGGLGYSNGVWILNDICEKLYSKSTKGITARSVNLEDMEKWLTEDGIKARNSYSGGLVKYGETTNYTERKNNWGEYYGLCKPDILYGKPKNESDKYYSEPTKKAYTVEYCTTFEVKQTYYWIEMNNENYGEGANVLKTTDSEGFYWVASRCIYCTYFDVASFELYAYNDFGDYYMADGYNMFDTYGDDCRWMYKVRPVVSLRSDIQVEKCSGTNNTDNMHTIKWN